MTTIEDLAKSARPTHDPVAALRTLETLRKAVALPRDGDGDGMIFDGTPQERPAPKTPGTENFFRPADTSGATGLPVLPWKDPPAPRGKPGKRKAGGFSASGRTATQTGDLAEEVARRFGLGRAQEIRQGALDAIADGWGYEIKSRSVESTGYRIGMRTAEMKGKNAEVKKLGLQPATIMVIMDEKAGRAWVYSRRGIYNGRLEQGSFTFAGEVKI